MTGWLSRLLAASLSVFLVAAGIAVTLAALVSPAHAERRVALVVGNNDYRNVPKLLKAVNDARTMGDTLKQLGFTVMVAENQSRQAFSQTLLAFDKSVEAGDTAFFFFAGHGFEIAGQNFLLPTDVPAATEGQEELVRDASVLADRIIERLQNRKVRTAILVFDACRNNPFERAGTRAVAGRGGLAPMTQLPEGVFSVFSAGPRQTALDRLSNEDTNPNSVFTRTFAKELTQPGANLVQVAQRTRRLVSELAETVRHKQIPVYFDQMVDDVFLNGMAKGQPEVAAKAEAPQKLAALPPVQQLKPQNDSVNAPIAMFSRHNGGWTVVFSIADPTLGISWRMGEPGNFRETGFIDTLDPRTRKRMPNPSIELPADAPAATIQVRYVDTNGDIAGPVPDQVRSGSRPDPRPAQDPRHDRDELAVVPRVQRAAGLLHPSDVVSLRDPRGARRHRQYGAGQGSENAGLRSARSQLDPARSDAVSETRAADQVGLGGVDIPRRQRLGDQEFPAVGAAWSLIRRPGLDPGPIRRGGCSLDTNARQLSFNNSSRWLWVPGQARDDG